MAFEQREEMEFEGESFVPSKDSRPPKRHKPNVIVVDDDDDDDDATTLRAISPDMGENEQPRSAKPHSPGHCPTCGCTSGSSTGRPGPAPGRRKLPPRAIADILREWEGCSP